MRLDRYLAESNLGTRKQVRQYVQEGKIKVNGILVQDPAREVIEQEETITYDGRIVKHEGRRYLMFHKPSGCITAKTDEMHKTVFAYFPEEEAKGLFPIGRLDKDTEGLLLFTNDGEFNQQLMHPDHHVSKKYFFWVLGTLGEAQIVKLQEGVSLNGQPMTSPAQIEILHAGTYEEWKNQIPVGTYDFSKLGTKRETQLVTAGYISITEGRRHQVKRMLKEMGCYVIYLKRVQIGTLVLDETLKPGTYRELTKQEYEKLLS
ncbi:pseudouridine synthase [Anaerosporobacter faecicola]|uniref:pseudouridine synthase n=1 Tax=Anaerosporobacter faecicola TaxID=2718714 RepID=UPI00143BF869|nr:pseudouridine synthase [Anaerosporobacter faecicola]